MDPVTCPMCEGAIPGKEIHTVKTCPGCGADLSALVRRRLAELQKIPPAALPPQPSSFPAQAAAFSLLAPCLSIATNLLGRPAVSGSRVGMLVLGTVCLLFITAGFIFGLIAFFGSKSEKAGIKAVAGIFINGLLISFVVLSLFALQKAAASANDTQTPPRKAWYYISGK